MTSRLRPVSPVVVGVDDPESSGHAVRWAASEAARLGVPLRLVHAWSLPAVVAGAPLEAPSAFVDPLPFQEAAQTVLDSAAARIREDVAGGDPAIETVLTLGSAGHVLREASRDATLLVVGTHHRGAIGRTLFGSVAAECTTEAEVPVVVVRPEAPMPGTGDVLVGLDDSAGGRAALSWAAIEAGRLDRRLVVIHAHPPALHGEGSAGTAHAAARRFVDQALSRLASSIGRPTSVAWRVVEGDPERVLTEAAARASLLVVGSRSGLNPVERFLGSVSRRCVIDAPCPVVVVPPTVDAKQLPCAS
jgi:nucleotide-binding universal stress UspA family protein